MKSLQLVTYTYPHEIVILVGGVRYTYNSSEFFCRRFLEGYERGGRFNSLNWFKRVSKVVKKEVRENESHEKSEVC